MDCQSIARRVVITAAVGMMSVALAADSIPLREVQWLAPERVKQAVSSVPAECVAIAQNDQQKLSAEIGRAAFRAPLLLGGQAARAGLSCNSCHRNGRGNVDFFFKGLSSVPGTADVTSSFMSSHRGDGVFNPKPIPDLSAAPESMKVSRDISSQALEKFIHGLIVEEFDGPEPSERTLQGVSDYVRLLQPQACPKLSMKSVSVADYIDDASRAVSAAQVMIIEKDYITARLMLASARSSLGAINERYSSNALAKQRLMLRNADNELAAVQAKLDQKDSNAGLAIDVWLSQWPARSRSLSSTESVSLFNPKRLLNQKK